MSQSDDPDADARNALRLIGPDPANWVPDRTGIDHNVTIVGGGQTGCALAFALRRAGIGKVTVLEAAPDEQRAGIWLNAARMNLLRTPKALAGTGTRHSGVQFSGVVRGPSWPGRLCRHRSHPRASIGLIT